MNEKTPEIFLLSTERTHSKQFTYCGTEEADLLRRREKKHQGPIPLSLCTLTKLSKRLGRERAGERGTEEERERGSEKEREREIYIIKARLLSGGQVERESRVREKTKSEGTPILGYEATGPIQSSSET